MSSAFRKAGEQDTMVDNQKEHHDDKKMEQSDEDRKGCSNQMEDIDVVVDSDVADPIETSDSDKVQEVGECDAKQLRAGDDTFEQPSNQVEEEIILVTDLLVNEEETIQEETIVASFDTADDYEKQVIRTLMEETLFKVAQTYVPQDIQLSSKVAINMIGQNHDDTTEHIPQSPKLTNQNIDSKYEEITKSTPRPKIRPKTAENASKEANEIHKQNQTSIQMTTLSKHSHSTTQKPPVCSKKNSKTLKSVEKASKAPRSISSSTKKSTQTNAQSPNHPIHPSRQSSQNIRISASTPKKPAKEPKTHIDGSEKAHETIERSNRQTHGRYANVESRVKQMIQSESQRNLSTVRERTHKEAIDPDKPPSAPRPTTSKSKFTSVTPRYLDYTASPLFYKNMQAQHERRKRLEKVNAAKSQERQQAIQTLFAHRKQEAIEETKEELRRGRDLHEYTTSVKSVSHSNVSKTKVSKPFNKLANA
uniref:Adhesinlike protein putative n=1 Tax=Albugo laibachii Nc14 TaxID=890382 RepID=F0WKU1_9STRA|nr:adhesinlike protein putative [Albugo laibachii Nc14]|eukprot:CCA21898.1 adhesinlike protein putative [Albugo laibachii Nc14]